MRYGFLNLSVGRQGMKLIKGYTAITVKGLNIEKLINRLSKEGIAIYRASRQEHKRLDFCVEYASRQKVIACLDNLCYNYQIEGDKGLLPLIRLLLKRAGLVAGCLIFAAALFFSSLFVADVRVSGCESIDPLGVAECARQAGAAGFSFNKPSAREIEKRIYESFGNISFVSASYKGLVLHIEVVEAQPAPAVIDNSPKDLVSQFDGKINRLIVYQGTPLVKAGDAVKKGQVLIGGFREKPGGERIPLRAMGEAYGVVELVYTERFECVRTELSRTGRFAEQIYIELFGLAFPVKRPDAGYATFEEETESCFIFFNNFLPARLVTVRRYETEPVTVREDFEKVKKVLVEEAQRKALEQAEKEGRVLGSSVSIRDEGDIKYIEVTLSVEKSLLTNGE